MNVDLILKIPLRRVSCPDQFVWHYENRGTYTVKSGYQVALFLNYVVLLQVLASFHIGRSSFGHCPFLANLSYFSGEHSMKSFPPLAIFSNVTSCNLFK